MWIERVTEILREAAAIAILPRYQALADGDVAEKSPGELVTVADTDAEALITSGLRGVFDAPVVGEEATAATPRLANALRDAPTAWLVDPLDGTANFVAGTPDYAVMAALVRHGQTVASWILRPSDGRCYVAERGSGAWRDGVRVVREPAASDPARLRGMASTRFLDPAARIRVQAAASRFAGLGPGTRCAGVDYPAVIDGEQDFALFQRTLPWDHAPGALLLTEAGGVVQRPNGAAYQPSDAGLGLLSAPDATCWRTVRSILIG